MYIDKNNQPLVSIIVITYNSARFVLETLESAKAQTYQNLELIVSDDSSTDDTVNICKNWIEKNKYRFVYIQLLTVHKNSGISANINRAIKATHTEWIKNIAGDDTLLPTCIEDNISYVRAHANCYIVQSEMISYKERFCPECLVSNFFFVLWEFKNELATSELQYKILLYQNQVYTPSVFCNKKVFNDVGGYDESIPFLEDYPMWLRITKAGYKIFYFDKITVNYRIHINSESNPSESLIFTLRMHKSLEIFYEKYIYSELPLINRALKYSNCKFRDFIIYFNLNKKKGPAYFIDRILSMVSYKYDYIILRQMVKGGSKKSFLSKLLKKIFKNP